MRTGATLLGSAMLVWASTAAAQVQQPPAGTMSPSELPPGFAVPPGVGLVRLAPPPDYVIPPGYIAATSSPVPLWREPPAEPPGRRYRSVPMMAAGIVLLSVGATIVVSGVAYLATRDYRCPLYAWGCPLDVITAGSMMIIGGGVLGGAVGGPLLAIGAGPPEPTRAPTVSLGPGSASLHWTF